jgi:dihydrofolate reductase
VRINGGVAIRRWLDEDVIADMTISTVPVVIGTGRRLFGGRLGASTPNCLAYEARPKLLPYGRRYGRDLR